MKICSGLLARQLGKSPFVPIPFLPNPPALSWLSEPTNCGHRAFLPVLGLGMSPMAT